MKNEQSNAVATKSSERWIVCQIGAREHYAIPRALHQAGKLGALITDFWCPPGSLLSKLPQTKRLRDRWHLDLATATVLAPNFQMMRFEAWAKLRRITGWPLILARNVFFQRQAVRLMQRLTKNFDGISYLFSYSYAADELFQFARSRNWETVLGQIDPGPEEQRIVAEEHRKYPNLGSRWNPAPAEYWSHWRKEIALSNRIVINSDWSQTCLVKEGINPEKLVEIPLVYERGDSLAAGSASVRRDVATTNPNKLKVLFLGQINLRKGIGRLLDAMRILKSEPIELILAGLSEVDPSSWSDLPNVRWIGAIPRSEVGPVYQDADLFILPSLSDGYAITQLEALAYDLPVLRSNYCGNPFCADSADTLLENLEPHCISAAILRIFHNRGIRDFKGKIRCFSMRDLAKSLSNMMKPTELRRHDDSPGPVENVVKAPSTIMSDDEANSPTSAVAEAFTAISDHYAAHFVPAKTGTHVCFQKRLELVLDMTVGRKGAFMDCAVGPAEITAEVLLREKFDSAELVDISPVMLDKARERIQSIVPAENAAGVSFVTGDVFDVAPLLREKSFDLIFCLGLIAHTGRLDQMLSNLKPLLAPGGQILLQSTLMDHPGTKIVRFLTANRYTQKYGYVITYYYHKDIVQACERNGLRIVATRRFSLGIPFADRIWKWANYHAEQRLSSLAARAGSESLYLLESYPT